jgi:hypothetical protein
MTLFQHPSKITRFEPEIDLRGGKRGVTQKHLDGPHRSTVSEEMRGAAMTKPMGRHRASKAGATTGLADISRNHVPAQRSPIQRDEQSSPGGASITADIGQQGLPHLFSKRNDAILSSFPEPNKDQFLGEVHIVELQTAHLGCTESGSVKKLQQSTISGVEMIQPGASLQEARHFPFG